MTNSEIKTYRTPVLLVGGGEIAWDAFDKVRRHGYPIVAVDSGARYLAERGIIADVVIGDLDSLGDPAPYHDTSEVIKVPEQQSTDFEKALYSIGAPLFIAFGLWGKRLDHSLAALHIATKYRESKQLLMVDTVDLFFIPQGAFEMPARTGTRVSIFPLAPVRFSGSNGLKYPLAGLLMESGTAIGVSNETTGPMFEIVPAPDHASNYALIMPNGCLEDLLANL